MLRHDTVAGLNSPTHQPQARAAVSVHRDHHMGDNPVCIAFLHWSKAAAALRGGREFHLRGILNRQNMTTADRRAGSQAPAFDDLRRRHLWVGEEPARLFFATTVTTQPAQTYRLTRDHPFEDRAPPLSRRRSPNDPSDHSISAPVLQLPGGTESYSRRVGQAVFGVDAIANITCAHTQGCSTLYTTDRRA